MHGASKVYTHRPVCVRHPPSACSAAPQIAGFFLMAPGALTNPADPTRPRAHPRREVRPRGPRDARVSVRPRPSASPGGSPRRGENLRVDHEAPAPLGGDPFGHFRRTATRAPARARRGVRPQPPPRLEPPVALLVAIVARRRAAAASAMRPRRARVFHPAAGDHELARGRRRPPGRSASRATTRRRRRATGASARGGAAGRPRAAARAAPAAARAARERSLPSAERAPVLQPPWRRQRPPRPRPAALQA